MKTFRASVTMIAFVILALESQALAKENCRYPGAKTPSDTLAAAMIAYKNVNSNVGYTRGDGRITFGSHGKPEEIAHARECVERAISQGAPVDLFSGKIGRRSLILAVEASDPELTHFLLEHGASPKRLSKEFVGPVETNFQLTTINNPARIAVLKLLFKFKAPPSEANIGLLRAVRDRDLNSEIAKTLVEGGADVKGVSKASGLSILDEANVTCDSAHIALKGSEQGEPLYETEKKNVAECDKIISYLKARGAETTFLGAFSRLFTHPGQFFRKSSVSDEVTKAGSDADSTPAKSATKSGADAAK